MDQRKLYRTIEKITSQPAETEEQILINVLKEVVASPEFNVKGGRIWKLTPSKTKYKLIAQEGAVDKIRDGFTINVSDYPIFEVIAKERTVLATETNEYLRRKGIFKYSATGVGEKVKGEKFPLYQYLMAFSADEINEDLFYTLNIIGTAVTATLRNRKLEKRSKQLIEDIDDAAELQKRILPAHDFKFAGYEMFGISIPDRIVGGDFFDYLEVGDDNDRLGVAVADVANKGFAAAAEAFYVSAALRMGVSYQTQLSSLMKRLNNLVYKIFPNDRFVSLFYIELTSDASGYCTYCNAGHNSPILFRARTKTVELLESTGPLIGPAFNSKFKTSIVRLEKGDSLIIYTDGISEAMNEEGEEYGEERLIAKVQELHDRSAKEITQLLIEDVQKFSARASYSDDKTIVTLKRVE
ncbi:MAG: PP2C family protein-serine/threonine phosphatase [Ignavibacteria bacterium]|jgi:sigma-B regulation protein RsbU (phosphoserine phosphatase)|nr:serine/threonine-protein phosphatase [Ignavibacteria bacterium]MDH7527627.1 PP2C family protein-serine/threonine phosphatase [Ignavibacteria bacterium]NPV12202.1 serine/threonine-protein phosphatase [Ignavibacteria bacterium]